MSELTQKTINEEINKIGEDIKVHLNLQFKQWGTGLPFKTVFTKYSTKAKKLGYEVSMLSHVLQEMGYIEVISTPSGKRWIFSKDSKLDQERMLELVLSEEARIESEKEVRRLKA
jgi:hypothetical protein